MRDGNPPRPTRGSRAGAERPTWGTQGPPPAAPRGGTRPPAPGEAVDPYRTYRPYGSAGGMAGPSGRYRQPPEAPADLDSPDASWAGGWSTGHYSAELPSQALSSRHHGFSVFHDGNAGHLWRGEVMSRLGEATLSVGLVMWLAALTASPLAVAWAVVALGLPWLLAGPLAAPLQRASEPGRSLATLGRLRAALPLGFVLLHFHTILPLVYLLLFAISLISRLRDALCVAANQACLAPGEPERLANDLHIGTVIAAVGGPLVATLLFVLLGERIPLVAVGAAVFFLLSANSDSFLDALPEAQRAFLLAVPPTEEPDADTTVEDEFDADADPERRRELALPAWDRLGPGTIGQGIGDLRAGLGLAGATRAATQGLYAVALLALIGGGLAVLEVFYLTNEVRTVSYLLGVLVAAEGCGLALGALLAETLVARAARFALVVGLLLSGVLLAALAALPLLPLAFALALGVGVGNALALTGAQRLLLAGFSGGERRAISVGARWVSALCGVIGALLFVAFYTGAPARLPARVAALVPGWPIGDLLFGTGVGLVLAAIVFSLMLSLPERAARRASSRRRGAAGDDESAARQSHDESAYLPALDDDLADEDGPYADDDHWDETDDYADEAGPARPGYSDRRSDRGDRGDRSARMGRDGRYGDEPDWADDSPDDDPPPRGTRAPRGPSRGGRSPR